MGLKINKLYIKNFKVFEEVTIDFSKKKLTVFDGPNGFGKTSVYDAIELLLTGRIRRYKSLDGIIDRRENYAEIPFYNVNGDGTSIVIKAELGVSKGSDIETKVLVRKTSNKSSLLKLKNKLDFSEFKLYKTGSFDSQDADYTEVDTPCQFLKDLLGENYQENFEFLNYVEQEESYYMLKNKDKDRKNNIQHLFNTKEFQEQLDKIKAIKKHVQVLKKPLPEEVKQCKEEIEKLKNHLSPNEEVEYKQLFENKEHIWDKEKIDFTVVGYADLLGKEGVLAKVENLILYRDTFQKNRKNQEIQKFIDKRQTVLSQLLKFDKYIEHKNVVEDEQTLINSINNFAENSKLIDSKKINDGLLDLDANLIKAFSEREDIVNYNQKLTSIKELVKNSNKTSQLHSDMAGTRNSFIKYFEKYNKETGKESEFCPLCGKDWETQKELLKQIELQTETLKKLSEDITNGLTQSISEFEEQELSKLLEIFEKHEEKSFYNETYFAGFPGVVSKNIQSAKRYLENNDVEFLDLINTDTNPEAEIKIDTLLLRLREKIVEVDSEKIQDNFDELFSMYFDDKESLLFDFEIKEFEDKRKYIEWQYSLFQNSQLARFTTELRTKVKRLELLASKESDLKNLEREYANSLRSYNEEVIKDIELLFHIYTGRILLDYQCGLGLFIKNDKDGLRFVTNPKQTYDALFSMSAGQLSALIISFTLSLNKIYSRNKILLIDDPVQTMDEINISGCIELLRNEFDDRQIFISTHESMMSTYMRYKFEKFNLSTQRVNVKELAN